MTDREQPRRPWRPLGLRREVRVLLPTGLLLLIVLSSFTLLSYRGAVDLWTRERQAQAEASARRLAEELASRPRSASEGLQRLAPAASAITVLEPDGTPVTTYGSAPAEPLAPLGGRPPDRALGLAPGPSAPDAVVGFAPFGAEGRRRYVRVDLPASALASQRRSLPLLTTLVLGINVALVLLLLAFLRHLLTPYDTLLARARTLGGEQGEAEGDETAFLVSTFERAVEALERSGARSAAGDDLAALEGTLLASVDSGLMLLDRSGGVLSVNPPGEEILELTAPSPGTSLEVLLADRPRLRDLLQRAVQSRRGVRRQEVEMEHPEGGSATLGLSVHPLRREGGPIQGFLVLFTDLTESQREAEESRLAESLARLGELAAGVAHELRNSLATLRGYLGLIERRTVEPELVSDLEEMRRETDHLQRVVDDFLSFARPGTVRVEEVELAALAHRAAADPSLHGIRLEIDDRGAGGVRLQGDPQLLERALRNLLHNAREASAGDAGEGPPAEVLVVLAPLEEGGAEVRVEDRGPGIPEDLRGRLFQPFASGRPGGVGLGLAVCHRIATLHGGRIRIEDRPGGGTRARLQFPAPSLVAGEIVTKGNEGPS